MARKLRSDGLSVREIERRVGVARSSVSVWVRDVELTEEQRQYLAHTPRPGTATRHRRRRELCQGEGREFARRGEALHAIGCMLFWGEGSKVLNMTQITNSTPRCSRCSPDSSATAFTCLTPSFASSAICSPTTNAIKKRSNLSG
jgi:hypothetical protein